MADINKKLLVEHYDGDILQFDYDVPFYPATTVRSSVRDFSRFMAMYLQGGTLDGVQILQSSTIDMMWEQQNKGSSLGLLWWRYPGGWLGHAGAYFGTTAMMDLNPVRKSGVLIMTNQSQWQVSDPEILYPGGLLYKKLHAEANRY